ncbi:hypothetical protein [Jannaschia aquimarina]|uniref:Uncharacterized protein n=1 Tax=Jannaschia aquimarina TaxID=935700 RepID=A0A0D1D3P2_9RHOB|nr:hypothetical protein [Jannaschia aquimarina]KIT14723.1 hypothetical protein jaqu_35670 [Jannaschia aquimarina]SNT44203.1 hypothetical protein SAMN05421775_12610 [Jannaschia aquimarina]
MTEPELRAHLLGLFETINDRWDGVVGDLIALNLDGRTTNDPSMRALSDAADRLSETRDDLGQLLVDAGWRKEWREPLRLISVDGKQIPKWPATGQEDDDGEGIF